MVTRKRLTIITLVLACIWTVIFILSIMIGSVDLTAKRTLEIFFSSLTGADSPATAVERTIVLSLRVPRSILAALVGAGLSVSGAIFQALLRNPLADPYVLGVSSGSAVGAILAIFLGLNSSSSGLPLASFLGAISTVMAVFFASRQNGKIHPNTLLLAGVIISSFLSAAIMFFLSLSNKDELRTVIFWLMGDFSLSRYDTIKMILPYITAGIGILFLHARHLNLIAAGEEYALELGVEVHRLRLISYVSASLITAASVSVCGLIGFVGLIVPHSMRLLFGSDHRVLVPSSALAGASFLVASDTIARTALAPTELPVGVVTAAFGAPFFIYLLRKRKGIKSL